MRLDKEKVETRHLTHGDDVNPIKGQANTSVIKWDKAQRAISESYACWIYSETTKKAGKIRRKSCTKVTATIGTWVIHNSVISRCRHLNIYWLLHVTYRLSMLSNCLYLELTAVSRQTKASSNPAPSTHGALYVYLISIILDFRMFSYYRKLPDSGQ